MTSSPDDSGQNATHGASPGAPPSGRWTKLALVTGAVLVVAGGAAFYLASRKASQPASGEAITVTITDKTCEPNDLTVPAGRRTFRIINASSRTVEWEILDGVMVVEERENIAPGFSSTLTARLEAGAYQITCGLLSNPRGTLTVTQSAESGDATRPPLTAFIGPLAEYKVYLALESSALADASRELAEAIRDGDKDRARALYAPARALYRHVEPVAQRFTDLDSAISARADYLDKREADAAFTGFHRIEYGLFAQDDLAGLSPVADKLVADIAQLEERLGALQLPPEQMAKGATTLLSRLSGAVGADGEERYSGGDVASVAAALAGTAKIVSLLEPLTAKADAAVASEAQTKLNAAVSRVEALRGPQGYLPFNSLDAQARKDLADDLSGLAEATGRINAAIGLE